MVKAVAMPDCQVIREDGEICNIKEFTFIRYAAPLFHRYLGTLLLASVYITNQQRMPLVGVR